MHLELMRVPQRELPTVENPAAVRTTRTWHCKSKSLAPIGDFLELRELAVATYPDDDLEPIDRLPEGQAPSPV